jgi:Circularly permutated YpsA SLOG family
VIFTIGQNLTGGSRKTLELTEKHNKRCLHIHSGVKDAGEKLRHFVLDNDISTLNVAGSRASKEPRVWDFVRDVLEMAFPG